MATIGSIREIMYLTTLRCNCDCRHCGQPRTTNPEYEISCRTIAERLLESPRIGSFTRITVAGGEPLLKEDLLDFILPILECEKDCSINLSTNGFRVDKLKDLVNAIPVNVRGRFDVAVSIDGLEETHNKIRRNSNSFSRAIESVKFLSEEDIRFHVNTVVQNSNVSELAELKELLQKVSSGKADISYIPVIASASKDKRFAFDKDELKAIYPYITAQKDIKYLASGGKAVIHNCHAGQESLTIIPNRGGVYACYTYACYADGDKADFFLGNLKNSSLDDILNGKQMNDVLVRVKNCKGCFVPCEVVREHEHFGMIFELSDEEAELWASFSDEPVLLISGWHPNEGCDGAMFRWMSSKKSTIVLRNHEGCYRNVHISFENFYPDNHNDPLRLTVSINNQVYYEMECASGTNILSLEGLPQGDAIKITFATDKLWQPCNCSMSDDSRFLGIAVTKIEID